MDDVDRALGRLFRVRLMLGVFDPPTFVEYNYLYNSSSTVETPQHLQYAREVAAKSIALYKNNNQVLPLDPHTVAQPGGGIALIGPQFVCTDLLLGNYATYPDHGVRSIVQAMREGINESFTAHCTSQKHVIYDQPDGLNGSMVFNEAECAQLCYEDDECAYYSFNTADIYYGSSNAGYLSNCFLKATAAGYTTRVDDWNSGHCANKSASIGQSQVHNALGCRSVACTDDSAFAHAIDLLGSMYAAGNLQAVVVALGLNQSLESEGRDRKTIELPGLQGELVRRIYNFTSAKGIAVVCVLIHGGTLALGEAYTQCDAIVDAWYPGQMGGAAIADVLFGAVNPAGRASVTSYVSTSQLPAAGNGSVIDGDLYAGKGTTYRYFGGEVLVPFGHGLSYSQFRYSHLRLNVSGALADACGVVRVECVVTNVGDADGDEVVQMYVQQPEASVAVPRVRLADFERVEGVEAGESRNVSLLLTPRYRAVVYNQTAEPWYKPNMMIEAGAITVSVGGGQPAYVKNKVTATLKVAQSASFYTCQNQG